MAEAPPQTAETPEPHAALEPHATPESDAPEPPAEAAKIRGGWYAAIGLVTLGRALAIALLPPLLIEAPVLLILLSPTFADLVIAAPLLPPWLYFLVAMGSVLTQTSIAYHFGQALGQQALVWLQSRSPTAKRTSTQLLAWLERATPLVLMTMPGLTVSVLAGISGVRPRRFYVLIFIGNLAWTIACFVGGAALTDQLHELYSYVGEHLLTLTVLAAVLAGVQFVWTKLRRRSAAKPEAQD